MNRLALTGLVFLLAFMTGSKASAYVRSETQATGMALFWNTRSITYYLNQNKSVDISDGSDITAINQAFGLWSSVECTDMLLNYGGETSEKPGYNYFQPNYNVIQWVTDQKDWTLRDNPDLYIAVTTVTFNESTGEIYDADIELNNFQYRFSTTGEPETVDVATIMTHEAGHFLGLLNSDNLESIMNVRIESRDTLQGMLAQDDIDAVCDIYPSTAFLSSESATCAHFPSDSALPLFFLFGFLFFLKRQKGRAGS